MLTGLKWAQNETCQHCLPKDLRIILSEYIILPVELRGF